MAWKETVHRWLNENVADTRVANGPDGRLYTVPFARVWDTLLEHIARRPRWSLAHKDESLGILTVRCRTPVFRFVDDLSIWVQLDENGLTRVEARSRSRVGSGDWGVNRRRIERLLRKLDRSLGPETRLVERRLKPRDPRRALSAAAHRLVLLGVSGGFAAAGLAETAGARSSRAVGPFPAPAATDTLPYLERFQPDGDLAEWSGKSPIFFIPTPGEPGRANPMYVAQTGTGIAVAGVVGDRGLDLVLADDVDPAFPPIGWGHQFGFEELETEDGCDDISGDPETCRRWFRRQVAYREDLPALFRRRWHVSPDSAVEIGASAEFSALSADLRSRLAPLAPTDVALLVGWAEPRGASPGRSFEALVPWEALPPVQGLWIDAVRLGVEPAVADSDPQDGPRESGAGRREIELRTLRLPRPREYSLTPCRYGTESVVLESDSLTYYHFPSETAVRYIRPRPERDLRTLLILDNVAAGYQYEPEEQSDSPATFVARYYTRRLGDDELLCGPVLAHRRGRRVSASVDSTRTDSRLWAGGADMMVPEFYLEVREDGDEALLVKEGPRVFFSYYGSGQCGACPRVGLDLYHVDRTTSEITPAFSYVNVVDDRNVDVLVSDDWREVTIFEASSDFEEPEERIWRATTHCLPEGGRRFEVCAERDSVPAPSLGLLEGLWEEPPE